MKILGLFFLRATFCLLLAKAAANSAKHEKSWTQPIKALTDRRSISVQVTSNDGDSTEETEKKLYPLHGLMIKLRFNYDTGLENKLREKGIKEVWGFLEKVAAEAQKHFLHTNGRPYLRLNIQKGDSFTYPLYDYEELGALNLNSYISRPETGGIDANIYFAKQPTSINDYAVLFQNQICRNKKKSVALVLHNSYESEVETGQTLAVSIATLLGICKSDFTWTMKDLLKRYEDGKLPCLSEECIDHYSCSSQSANSCSDKVTAMLCPKKCDKCVIIFPPNGLQMRLRLNYNDDFAKSWKSIGPLAAMHNIVAYGESYFLDDNSKPYLRLEIINGTKFNKPSQEDLTVHDLDVLAQTLKDIDRSDADIFFGTSYSHVVQGEFYGSGKYDTVCTSRQTSVGIVLQGSFSYESGTAQSFSSIVASLLGLWSNNKNRWTMQEFKDAYENGKYQCLKPYVCHDQFPCSNRAASMCSDYYTKYLCPRLCGQCKA